VVGSSPHLFVPARPHLLHPFGASANSLAPLCPSPSDGACPPRGRPVELLTAAPWSSAPPPALSPSSRRRTDALPVPAHRSPLLDVISSLQQPTPLHTTSNFSAASVWGPPA
jgi:hypothetical protein